MTPEQLCELIAQAIGIVAMIFNILMFQNKSGKGAIAFQLVGASLFAVSYFMLGSTIGAMMNIIAVIRNLVFLNRERLRADHPLWLAAFIAMYLGAYALTFTVFGKEWTLASGILESLPVIAMTAATISYRHTDAAVIRRYGLIVSPTWLVYNAALVAIGAIVCEALSIASIVIGMLRLDREDKNA